MAKNSKSQIKQAFVPINEEELDIYDKTMSPYIVGSNDLMKGFLKRLERMHMQNYKSVKLLENHYNYANESPNK